MLLGVDLRCNVQGTVLMALLQPAPEVYDLFDDIMLLAEGHIVFHGPKEQVRGLPIAGTIERLPVLAGCDLVFLPVVVIR